MEVLRLHIIIGVIFAVPMSMDQNYQQLDLQTLIDLLAEETRQYTKAFISGTQDEIRRYKANTDSLVAEINRRKKEEDLPPTVGLDIPPNDYFEVSP
jgi:hypothetical protein